MAVIFDYILGRLRLADSGGGGQRPLPPVGSVFAFAGATAPDRCLICNGAEVSRAEYAALFAAIGTTYGDGDGTTTFLLPDLQARFLEGAPAGDTPGAEVAAGLPNITGQVPSTAIPTGTNPGYWKRAPFVGTNNGAFATSTTSTTANYFNTAGVTTSTQYIFDCSFSAARSSSVYGASTTVQPPALTMIYIIVAQ